jgi:branched-chain amino acid aminotransferase
MKRGIRVKISSFTRHHVNITMTQAKAVSNTPTRFWPTWKPQTMVTTNMLLDANGFCLKARGRNLFIDQQGVVYTPDQSAGALNGITAHGVSICQLLIWAGPCAVTATSSPGTAEAPTTELGRDDYAGTRGPITEKSGGVLDVRGAIEIRQPADHSHLFLSPSDDWLWHVKTPHFFE